MADKKSTKSKASEAKAEEKVEVAPEAPEVPATSEAKAELPAGHVRLAEPFKCPEGMKHIQWSGQKVQQGAQTMPKQLAEALQLDFTEE